MSADVVPGPVTPVEVPAVSAPVDPAPKPSAVQAVAQALSNLVSRAGPEGPVIVPRGTYITLSPPSTLAQKVVRAIVIALVAAFIGSVVYVLRFIAAPVVLAFLTFYVLNPIVNLLESRRLPRGAAVAITFTVLLGVIGAVGAALWPSLDAWLQQTPQPGEQSDFEIQLAARLDAWEAWGRGKYPQIDWHAVFENVRTFLDRQRLALTEGLPTLLMGAASSAGTYLLAPIIALFLVLDGAAMHRAIVSYVPNRYFETVLLLIHRVDRQISFYLRGAASDCAAVAVLLSTALMIAGMPNALLFGVLFGVLNVIPVVGPVIGMAAGFLYALMDPAAPPLGVLAACYLGVYALDGMLIQPLLVGKNLNLHPLTIIVGITVGGGLGGILGMLVAIPTIAIGKAIGGTLFDAYRSHRMHRLGV